MMSVCMLKMPLTVCIALMINNSQTFRQLKVANNAVYAAVNNKNHDKLTYLSISS